MVRGDRIHNLRMDRSMTLEELGSKIGVGKGTVKKYENGIIENIPSDKIEALAQSLETTPEYLMGWSDDPEQPKQFGEESSAIPITLDKKLIAMLSDLSPQEEQIVMGFLAGLKANRTT